jgi:predicted ribosome quality control (RQC) complex YloA/Tae2 family protein
MKIINGFEKFLESKKFPNLKKIDIDGFLVLMGKDSQSNDHLSINMAEDDDLWFHAKGVPGSHVLIRVKDKLPTQEVIKQVAEIAAKNSKAKGKVTVVYCKAKFVTKSSDMKPGQVNVDYKNSEEIEIEI